jgi:hypothetical protein
MTVTTTTGADRVTTRIDSNPDLLQKLSLLAMDVNDNAGYRMIALPERFLRAGLLAQRQCLGHITDKSVMSPSSD